MQGPVLPQPIFLREIGGWMFIARNAEMLQTLPKNPAALLAGLDKKYAIAVRAYAQNVPQPLREAAMAQIQKGLKEATNARHAAANFAGVMKLAAKQRQVRLSCLFNGLDELTLGITVDSKNKEVYEELTLTAVSGSELARQIEYQLPANPHSNYAGFLLPKAAFAMNGVSKVWPADAKMGLEMIGELRKAMDGIIEKEAPNATQKAQAKKCARTVFDLLEEILKDGKSDFGAVVGIKGKNFVVAAGAHIADGSKAEKVLKQFVEVVKDEPEFPGVKWDVAKHRDVRFHTMNIPVPAAEEDARKVFGKTVEVVVGIGPKSIYFAVGRKGNGIATLKRAINRSVSSAKQSVLPMQMRVSIKTIVQFIALMQPHDENVKLIASLYENSKGGDVISLKCHPIKNGMRIRLTIEDGNIEVLGKSVQAAQKKNAASMPGGSF